MRRYRVIWGTLILFLVAIGSQAETDSASSSPFSFPSFTGIRQSDRAGQLSYFKFTGYATRSGLITFKWSFPSQAKKMEGTITVYSLRGQTVKVFQVASQEGMVQWNASKETATGLYLARIEYGTLKQNLRLIFTR